MLVGHSIGRGDPEGVTELSQLHHGLFMAKMTGHYTVINIKRLGATRMAQLGVATLDKG
jgi:hypothetical protein